jgi:cytochrome P450 family 117 subfamily A
LTPTRDGFPVLDGAWPLLGHSGPMFYGYRELHRRAEERLGPVFWVDIGFGGSHLVCLHPEGFAVLRNKATTSTHYQERAAQLLGESLIVQDGERHAHLRQAMNRPFMPRGLAAASVGSVITDTTEARVRTMVDRGEVRILAETRELALDVIFRMLGIEQLDLPEWRHHYEEYVLGGLHIPLSFPGTPRWRARRAQRWLDERLRAAIARARREPDESALLGQMVQAKDDEGQRLSEHDLCENLRLLALAGHETSAATMAWMAIELATRPALWDRLVAEAESLGELPRAPKDLAAAPLAEALFREALRLHPPVCVVSRRVTGHVELCGRTVPTGIDVALNLDRLSRHESIYDAPDAFRPDRWLERRVPLGGLELVQFGGGPHFCLGYHVALFENAVFALALASELSRRGLRPALSEPFPRTRFLPLAHPSPSTRVRFVAAPRS